MVLVAQGYTKSSSGSSVLDAQAQGNAASDCFRWHLLDTQDNLLTIMEKWSIPVRRVMPLQEDLRWKDRIPVTANGFSGKKNTKVHLYNHIDA